MRSLSGLTGEGESWHRWTMFNQPPLLSDDVRAALPALYSTEHDDDPLVRVKLFTPWTNWSWYVTEFDGDDVMFGLVSGHEVELGYFTLSELAAIRGPGGLCIERDLHFTPRPLSQVRKEVAQLRAEPGVGEAPEEQPAYVDIAPIPELLTAATGPLVRPAIKMLETRLSGAWAAAVSGTIATPGQAAAIVHRLIGEADREHFVALYLNNRHQITHAHIVSRGTAQSAPVHPREVFKAAVLANAAAVVVGHNHPSGDVQPSRDDSALIERLRSAGEVLGIEVLDALVVGPSQRFHSASLGHVALLEASAGTRNTGSNEFEGALKRLSETAQFILGGTAGDMLEESAEELAQQVVDLAERLRHRDLASSALGGPRHEFEIACRGLLQDIDEVLERQGEAWWDDTVTSGTHHRTRAERLLGRTPYAPPPEVPEPS